jgi:hypothetical protein
MIVFSSSLPSRITIASDVLLACIHVAMNEVPTDFSFAERIKISLGHRVRRMTISDGRRTDVVILVLVVDARGGSKNEQTPSCITMYPSENGISRDAFPIRFLRTQTPNRSHQQSTANEDKVRAFDRFSFH